MISIKIKTAEGAKLPEYQTAGAAGADVYAFLKEDVVLRPGETKLVPTGLFMEIPEGFEVQIRPRSGLALKNGIGILNAPGTIDSDYRGEVGVIVTNFGSEDYIITNRARIAQMVIAKVEKADFILAESLTNTERMGGGFGHSGV